MTDTDTRAPEEEHAPLLQLVMEVDPEGHAAAYLPIRWRLDRKLVAKIREKEFSNPHLMITLRRIEEIVEFGRPRTRLRDDVHIVVPLKQELVHVAFRRPGCFEVIATVVDVRSDTHTKQVNYWIDHPGSTYGDSLFATDGTVAGEYLSEGVPFINTYFLQEVEVDEAMFAPPRTGWTKWLVDQFNKSRSRDECHFRRRLVMALLGSVILLTLGMAIRSIGILGALVAGMRKINSRWMLPFNMSDTLIEVRGYGSIWFHQKQGARRAWPFWVIFNPVVLVGGPLLLWLINPGWSLRTLALIFAGYLIGASIAGTLTMLEDRRRRSSAKQQSSREEIERRMRERTLAQLEAMTSDGTDLTPQVGALPRHKRTLLLRFSELKGKVCKPFAR